MSFAILYVEDREKDWYKVAKAVEQFNARLSSERAIHEKVRNVETGEHLSPKLSGEKLLIERARNPEELREMLDLRFDVILADVRFKEMVGDVQGEADRLNDIVRYVESWKKAQPEDRQLPIIAYTGTGKETLRRCLELKEKLYDIWDKNTASPDYVAWRLSRLAVDVARLRPDAKMQYILQQMDSGAQWHEHMIDMAKRYDAGWTERDQVERAGHAISGIAHQLGVWEQCDEMWSIMKKWEWLGRAASRGVRGHARHVINVFWLGYVLLHQHPLESFWKRAWRQLIANREGMGPALADKPLDALSNTWFYAGLFHDIAGCLEKGQHLLDVQFELVRPLCGKEIEAPKVWDSHLAGFQAALDKLAADFDQPLGTVIKEIGARGLRKSTLDHGLLAAIHLRGLTSDPRQACFAREAAKAVALHNLYPDLEEGLARGLTWETEPVVCLLLLCDQLQTWDRERGDEALQDEDKPHRAELAELEVTNGKRPTVGIRIDYIAPPHVLRSREVYDRVRVALEHVLKARPSKTLRMVGQPWPFQLDVRFSLSGRSLSTYIRI